jgi:hypothetical protein
MKNTLLSILTVLAATGMQAQLTQTNHAPAAGESYQMYQVDSTNINPGASGAGMTWTYTIPTRTTILLNFSATTNTNTAFPSASVALSSGTSNTSYYTSSTAKLDYFGGNFSTSSGGTNVKASLNYTAPAVAAVYPMSLNSNSTATTGGSITVTSPLTTNGTFNGTSGVILDATGTLTMPGSGTFTNVSRVVTTQTVNFTTPIASGTLTQMVYDYYSAGTKEPILSILTATANVPALGAPTQTLVYRNKNATSTPTGTSTVGMAEQVSANISVYPNPSSSVVNFTGLQSGRVMVFDVTGKLVAAQSLIEGRTTVDVSQFNNGLYIYKINDSSGQTVKTGKITVTH